MNVWSEAKAKLKDVMGWIEPDPADCRDEAMRLQAAFPGDSPEQLAERVMHGARRMAVAAGAVTGLAASPLTMLPAALADAVAVLKIEARMAGVIGALLDPAGAMDEKLFRADVLSIVFPSAATQALRQAAIRSGEQVTKAVVRKYVSEDLLKSTLRYAVEFLGIELSQKAIVSKTVPVIGAGIGAAWNWLEVKAMGKRAIRYHRPKGAPKRMLALPAPALDSDV